MYREVPSNTKTKLLSAGVPAWSLFRVSYMVRMRLMRARAKTSYNSCVKWTKRKGCRLSHAADMALMLTNGLKNTPGVGGRAGQSILSSTQRPCVISTVDTVESAFRQYLYGLDFQPDSHRSSEATCLLHRRLAEQLFFTGPHPTRSES